MQPNSYTQRNGHTFCTYNTYSHLQKKKKNNKKRPVLRQAPQTHGLDLAASISH